MNVKKTFNRAADFVVDSVTGACEYLGEKSRAARGALVAGGSALAVSAHAAVPTEVTTALSDMKADALTVAGMVLVAIIAVVAFKFMRKGF